MEEFKKVIFHGYCLSYLVHFPSVLRNHPTIWRELEEDTFQDKLQHHVTDGKQIQLVFNHYLKALKKTSAQQKGPVAIVDDALTRIPPENLMKYYHEDELLLIKTNRHSHDTTNRQQINLLDFLPVHTEQAKIMIKRQIDTIINKSPKSDFYKNIHVYNMLIKRINAIIDQIVMTEKMLKVNSVSAIIISSPNHFSRVMAFVAAKKGIPTICLQHGIIGNEIGYLPKVATVDAVYGHFEKEWYQARGSVNGSVKIIGHPRFDQAQQKSSMTKLLFYQQLNLEKKKKTLLLIVRGERHLLKWELLIGYINKHLDINIILRDFPNANNHKLIKKFPQIISTSNLDLYDILPHVDAVVSYSSTVALEAMLVGKSVFILHTRLKSYTGYYNNLDPFVQKDPEKLASIIQLYFHNKRWQKKAAKTREAFLAYAYPNRHSSGERLWKLTQELSRKTND